METALLIILAALAITIALGLWNAFRKKHDPDLERALVLMSFIEALILVAILILQLLAEV